LLTHSEMLCNIRNVQASKRRGRPESAASSLTIRASPQASTSHRLVTTKALALVNGASSYNSPGTNAVVWVDGCTGTLVAPDVVLTAAHCVPIPGGHDDWSLQDGNWHPFPNGVSLEIRFGPDSFQSIFTARATWFNDVPRTLTGGHDDITLLGLDRKVPEYVAI